MCRGRCAAAGRADDRSERHSPLQRTPRALRARLEPAGAVAAVIQSLVAWLAGRIDEGHPGTNVPAWRIEENRWAAARHGVEGYMADLGTGERRPTRERLLVLIERVTPAAAA